MNERDLLCAPGRCRNSEPRAQCSETTMKITTSLGCSTNWMPILWLIRSCQTLFDRHRTARWLPPSSCSFVAHVWWWALVVCSFIVARCTMCRWSTGFNRSDTRLCWCLLRVPNVQVVVGIDPVSSLVASRSRWLWPQRARFVAVASGGRKAAACAEFQNRVQI